MKILLVAGKHSLTGSIITGSVNMWMEMTKITAFVHHKLEQFIAYWEKWINYVTQQRPDFIFTNP